jgi:hypothetical protein
MLRRRVNPPPTHPEEPWQIRMEGVYDATMRFEFVIAATALNGVAAGGLVRGDAAAVGVR